LIGRERKRKRGSQLKNVREREEGEKRENYRERRKS
tara:strand:+ start:559 stop:666 length:108 start_codon:yes stop_codon:yes gene_type:complete